MATSATIVDREDPDAARNFAARFFGVDATAVVTISEDYENEVWAEPRIVPPEPSDDPAATLDRTVQAVEDEERMARLCATSTDHCAKRTLATLLWQDALYDALSSNEVVFRINEELASPRKLRELPAALERAVGRSITEAEVLVTWLTLGAASRRDGRPLLRPVIHAFVRGISGAVVSFPRDSHSPQLWLAAEQMDGGEGEKRADFPVTTCTTCGQHYFVWDVLSDWWSFLQTGSIVMVWRDARAVGNLRIETLGEAPKEIVDAEGVLLVKRK